MQTKSKILAAAAWGALAVSTAAPAEALIYTTQTGSYAAVTGNYRAEDYSTCGYSFNYRHLIKFISTSCNKNYCNTADMWPWVQFAYSGGRKVTNHVTSCSSYSNVFSLSNCAC